jgi:hypothetical protein
MTDEIAARKARMIETLTSMAEEWEQMATDTEYVNRRFHVPVDVGEFHVKAHAAREALRAAREDRPIEPRLLELLKPEESDL